MKEGLMRPSELKLKKRTLNQAKATMKYVPALSMKMKLASIIVAAFRWAASPALLAQGCCAGGSAMKEGCAMAGTAAATGHEGHVGVPAVTSQQNPGSKALLAQPVQAVFDNYLKVQGSLAQDSLEGVPKAATAMVKAIQGDSKKLLSLKVATQANALAQAKDLKTARVAFKLLSESLILHLKEAKVPSGTYREAYCPMAKASWLQTGTTVLNPYMGKSMADCGRFKS